MALHKFVAVFNIFVSTTLCTNTMEGLYLTQMIKNNKLKEARNFSIVSPETFQIKSYSGFLTVNETFNSNLFFWYFPVANKDLGETPWIIWLQGGPGASSLFGLFKEVGPLQYNNGIQLRESSWCQHYSMVFIDNPVGAGFSFTDKSEGYPEGMEMYSDNLYTAVKQLAQIYPELGKAPLYIAGESYAGRYIPGLAMKILDGQQKGENLVNLQGLIMGNPTLDRDSAMDYINAFYSWGMIDAQEARAAQPLQEEFQLAVRNEDPIKAYNLRDQLLDQLLNTASKLQTYNALKGYDHLSDFSSFIERSEVRKNIHVGNKVFNFSSPIVHTHMMKDSLASVSPKIEKILEHCRVLIYCGQLDLTTPCVQMAEARRKKWYWSGKESFLKAPRLPWTYEGNLTGYVKSGGRLTEVSITDSGHLVPLDKPDELLHLVTSFIENTPLDLPKDFVAENVPEYEEYIPKQTSAQSNHDFKIGFILSFVLNVLLLVGIAVSVVYLWKKFKKQNNTNLLLTEDIGV